MELKIPAYSNKYKVTAISNSAFENETNIESVVIPDTVESIGENAFKNCNSLTSINVSENNTEYQSIDGNLYSKDGTMLIQYAIGKANTNFDVPDDVTSIGSYAFLGCSSLESLYIGSNVTSLGSGVFDNCSSLAVIHYEKTLSSWDSLTSKLTLPIATLELTDFKFSPIPANNPTAYSIQKGSFGEDFLTGKILLPSEFNKLAVTSIPSSAFIECWQLNEIVVPYSITSIASQAFKGCTELNKICMENSVDFGEQCFADCTAISEVHVTSLDTWCNSSFTNEKASPLWNGATATLYINEVAVNNEISFEDIAKINAYAFYNYNKLESVIIPSSLKKIGKYGLYVNHDRLHIKYESTLANWIDEVTKETNSLPQTYKIYCQGDDKEYSYANENFSETSTS